MPAISPTPIHVEAEGIVYRNPAPHVCAIHAWHPRLVPEKDGRIIATFDLGQTAESLDQRNRGTTRALAPPTLGGA